MWCSKPHPWSPSWRPQFPSWWPKCPPACVCHQHHTEPVFPRERQFASELTRAYAASYYRVYGTSWDHCYFSLRDVLDRMDKIYTRVEMGIILSRHRFMTGSFLQCSLLGFLLHVRLPEGAAGSLRDDLVRRVSSYPVCLNAGFTNMQVYLTPFCIALSDYPRANNQHIPHILHMLLAAGAMPLHLSFWVLLDTPYHDSAFKVGPPELPHWQRQWRRWGCRPARSKWLQWAC
jgi:hypothetical protein